MSILSFAFKLIYAASLAAFAITIILGFWHGYKIKIGQKGCGFYWKINQKPIKRFFKKNRS